MKWLLLFLLPAFLCADISALYLTWTDDPTTTMTIQWHTDWKEPENRVAFRKAKSGEWTEILGSNAMLASGFVNVHRLALTQLESGAEYEFRIGEETKVYRFRTMPETLEKPVSFAVGGDVFLSRKIFRRMCQAVAARHPDFIVLGGDIAYAYNNNPFRLRSTAINQWLAFLDNWTKYFVAEDGFVTPLLIVVGNHDLSRDDPSLLFSLFAFPEMRFFQSLDFGDYLNLILLDTNHYQPVEEEQTKWLEQTLQQRQSFPFRFAVYHNSAYPSVYSYEGQTAQRIREHWCPLFDRYGVQAAFEHHNHAFKRTYPIRGNQVDAEGTLYLGDGCWGAMPRVTRTGLWYLEKAEQRTCVWLAEMTSEGVALEAIDDQGAVFDETAIKPSFFK